MTNLDGNDGRIDVGRIPVERKGKASLLTLTFGCFFFDYDNDGWPDIFLVNGGRLGDGLLVTLGVYSITGREVTEATVAAVLTVLGCAYALGPISGGPFNLPCRRGCGLVAASPADS